MEIHSSLPLPISAPTPSPAQQALALKIGAVLDVLVQARLGENRFLLQVAPDGPSFTARSATDLQPGQRLALEVIKLGSTPTLRLPSPAPTSDTTVRQALLELLPKLSDPGELAAALRPMAELSSSALPDPVRTAVDQLLATLPPASELETPEGVRKALRNSGLFFEAGLAAVLETGSEFPANDLKAQLSQLLSRVLEASRSDAGASAEGQSATQPAALPTSPTSHQAAENSATPASPVLPNLETLAHKVEGALARITLDQLASLPRQDGALALQVEIPFRAGPTDQTARLLISTEGERRQAGEMSKNWAVTLELQPPGLGRLGARVVWNGAQIDTWLWSDQDGTADLVRAHAETLRARLEGAGLSVGRLDMLDRPPNPSRVEDSAASLLDLRA